MNSVLKGMGLAVLLAAGCYRQDVRTITVKVPQMKSDECAAIVQKALQGTDGIKAVAPDTVKGEVQVTYEALKMGILNIQHVIADTGFDANDTPGSPAAKAKLPAACR